MTSTGTTPAAGVDHPLARALVTSLDALVPVVEPGEINLWQLGDDQCSTTLLTLHCPKGLRELATYLLDVIAPEIAEATEALSWRRGTGRPGRTSTCGSVSTATDPP